MTKSLYPLIGINPNSIYKNSKAKQKLKYNKIVESFILDPNIFYEIEKLSLLTILNNLNFNKIDENIRNKRKDIKNIEMKNKIIIHNNCKSNHSISTNDNNLHKNIQIESLSREYISNKLSDLLNLLQNEDNNESLKGNVTSFLEDSIILDKNFNINNDIDSNLNKNEMLNFENIENSFVDNSILKIEKLTPFETIEEHNKFLQEYIDTNPNIDPSGWRNKSFINSLKKDNTIYYINILDNLENLKENYCFSGNIEEEKKIFSLEKKLGSGSFATVFKLNNENVAIKIQSPPCPWEYYIMKELKRRTNEFNNMFISPISCYLSPKYSLIEMQYYTESYSLLEIVNCYRCFSKKLPEVISLFYTLEMIKCLEILHNCEIIHGDFKADNILVCFENKNQAVPIIKAIDFGRSIDLSLITNIPSERDDIASSFCKHLSNELPWNQNIDYLYLVESLYLLLFLEYPQKPYPSKNNFLNIISSKIPRYFQKSLWLEMFTSFVNNVEKTIVEESKKNNLNTSIISIYKNKIIEHLFPKYEFKLRSLLREERNLLRISKQKLK